MKTLYLLLLITSSQFAFASANSNEKILQKFKACKNQDIILYLPPFSRERINKDTLYMGLMNIIQKTPDGYLMMPQIPKGGGAEQPVLFVKMNQNWSGRTYSGWFYYVGEYKYTALDGFERKVPKFQVYPGHVLLKSCNEGKPASCLERNGNGCI